ncbi:MAG TPA: acetyl-CoA carboxylase biotin carboxyl carrier protein [Candidatus Eremiobacteraeota bacterium]|nr:MAG: Biotin carboxyl carrier protein of acetyl-CoA carboxylase [bacterium ADurb.Bin363]HPZ06964.1 acetyl-CoA carboxylase biotin carboxyl carrier protein [Candidatus Eremiobacteraeota bacterium]
MNLDFGAIQKLIEASERCDLSELIVEYDGVKIEIRRDKKRNFTDLPVSTPISIPSLPSVQNEKVVVPEVSREEKKMDEYDNKYYKVISPLVGVFYRSPWPGANPFVDAGDKVSVGQTLCIVEAMKLMNEITTEVSGTVVKILPKNEDVVQNGDVLFLIDPA